MSKTPFFHLFIYFFIHTFRSINRAKRNPSDGIFVAIGTQYRHATPQGCEALKANRTTRYVAFFQFIAFAVIGAPETYLSGRLPLAFGWP